MPKCRICHKNLKLVTNTHLKFKHNLSVADYYRLFPGKNITTPPLPQLKNKNTRPYKNWKASLTTRPEPWNKGKRKETHPSVRQISETMKKNKIDNLLSWRKENLKCSYPDFEKNKNLAELIGLVLGDGSLCQHERTERLLIAFNSKYPKIIERGQNLLFAHFKKEPAVFFNKTKTCTKLSLYEKNIGMRLGIPVGDKRKFDLHFPNWVWDSQETILSCLLGLYNAEGSLSVYLPSRAYIMSFSNSNQTLLEDVFKALKMLKYNPNLRTNKVNLRRRKEILRFCQQIRFSYYRGSNYCRVE